MPTFFTEPLTEGRAPLDGITPVPTVIDSRNDTGHRFTIGSDALLADVSDASGAAQTVGRIVAYTDNNVATPVALSEVGGSVTPDSITAFQSFRVLDREFRLWTAELRGRATAVRAHFTRETSATEANVYQIFVLGEPFLTLDHENVFQRIDLEDEQRGSVVHESIRGRLTVDPGPNPSAKRRVGYRARYREKQWALDLRGVLERYPHFTIIEDLVNFPERIYEGILDGFSIRYSYSTTWRGSGFDVEFAIRER